MGPDVIDHMVPLHSVGTAIVLCRLGVVVKTLSVDLETSSPPCNVSKMRDICGSTLLVYMFIRIAVCDGSRRAVDDEYIKSVVPKVGIKGRDK